MEEQGYKVADHPSTCYIYYEESLELMNLLT